MPAYREVIAALLARLVPDPLVRTPNLPTTAEVAVLRQAAAGRTLVHLIHAVPQRRGATFDVVEDVVPLFNIRLGVCTPPRVAGGTLAPTGEALPHETSDGVTRAAVPRVDLHQVVVFTDP